jgi:predicted secreted Zn-dependent protease
MKAAVTTALIIACASLAIAQTMHRCERDGKISFSDVPCAAGAKATTKAYAPSGGATGTLEMQVAVKTYPVEGRNYDALTASLRARGPQGFHGLAKWRVSYEFTSKRERGLCRVDTVRVTIAGEILMPHWTEASLAQPALQRHWSDYYAALKVHEDGHIQHGRELAVLVKERLLGLGAVPCERLNATAQGEFNRLYANLRNRDAEYDARTGHGATQGAYFRRLPQF